MVVVWCAARPWRRLSRSGHISRVPGRVNRWRGRWDPSSQQSGVEPRRYIIMSLDAYSVVIPVIQLMLERQIAA